MPWLARILQSPTVMMIAVLLTFVALAMAEPVGALMLAPAGLLLLILSRGHLPGEELIARLRDRAPVSSRSRAALVVRRPALPFVARPMGRICVSALAMRPPPVAAPLVTP